MSMLSKPQSLYSCNMCVYFSSWILGQLENDLSHLWLASPQTADILQEKARLLVGNFPQRNRYHLKWFEYGHSCESISVFFLVVSLCVEGGMLDGDDSFLKAKLLKYFDTLKQFPWDYSAFWSEKRFELLRIRWKNFPIVIELFQFRGIFDRCPCPPLLGLFSVIIKPIL